MRNKIIVIFVAQNENKYGKLRLHNAQQRVITIERTSEGSRGENTSKWSAEIRQANQGFAGRNFKNQKSWRRKQGENRNSGRKQ